MGSVSDMTAQLIAEEEAVVPPLLAPLSAALDELGGAELWRLGDDDAVAGVQAAYALATRAHAIAIQLLGETDRRGLAIAAGAASTRDWLTARCRLRPSEVKRDVELARLTAAAAAAAAAAATSAGGANLETPAPVEGEAVHTALAAGQMSVEQAGCVATALAELPSYTDVDTKVLAEQLLTTEALEHGPAALTRLGHRIAERVDPDAADRTLAQQLEREERQARRLRSATRWVDGHGSVFYRLRIGVGDDAHLFPVLDALAAPDPAGPSGRDDRTAPQRLADAFVETFRRVSLDGGLPQAGGDRPRILIGMDLDHLRRGVGAGAIIDTGDQLAPSAVRRLACDAQVVPAVLGGASAILDIGRARRTFDGPIRLAVVARDRGCVHPGCTRPARWCDVHHVIAWWNGGATSLGNGVLLCGYHHRLYDDQIWQIRFAADATPESIPPDWLDRQRRPIRHTRYLEHRRPGRPAHVGSHDRAP